MDYKKKIIDILTNSDKELTPEQEKQLESIFPELAESEDEKIRKTIVELIIETKESYKGEYRGYRGLKWKTILAWLERQGVQKHIAWSEDDRTMAFTLMRDVDQMSYISKEGKNERIGWLNSLDEKFASIKSTWSEDDEEKFNITLFYVRHPRQDVLKDTMLVEWLKSLRDRLQH